MGCSLSSFKHAEVVMESLKVGSCTPSGVDASVAMAVGDLVARGDGWLSRGDVCVFTCVVV